MATRGVRRGLRLPLLLLPLAGTALAVLPDEMLKDPVLEGRARVLQAGAQS